MFLLVINEKGLFKRRDGEPQRQGREDAFWDRERGSSLGRGRDFSWEEDGSSPEQGGRHLISVISKKGGSFWSMETEGLHWSKGEGGIFFFSSWGGVSLGHSRWGSSHRSGREMAHLCA